MSDIESRPWPQDPRYLALSDGSVVGARGWTLKPWLTDNGYLQVHVGSGDQRRGVTVHIIVCEAWHGPRPLGMEVAHKNGVRVDCRPENLHWKTRPDNHADKIEHGTQPLGEAHVNHKLTDEAVRTIRASSESCSSLAIRYGVGRTAISAARTGKTWRHVA